MKKCFAILISAGVFLFASCKGQKTCPTYLKNKGMENTFVKALK
jgi:hypothetical protein